MLNVSSKIILCFMAVPNGKAYLHVCPFYVYISPSSGREGLVADHNPTRIDWLIDFLVFNATFSNISAISWRPVFSGGRNGREPPTMGKQLVNFITCGCESSATFFCNLQSRVRTHAVLVIGLYELLGNPTT